MVRFEGDVQLFLVVFLFYCSLIILDNLLLTRHFERVWVHHATVALVLDQFLINFFFIAFYFWDFVKNIPFEYHVIDVCQRSRKVHGTFLRRIPFSQFLLSIPVVLFLTLPLVGTNQRSSLDFRSNRLFFLINRSRRILNLDGAATALSITPPHFFDLGMSIIAHFLADCRNGDVSVLAAVIYGFGLVAS